MSVPTPEASIVYTGNGSTVTPYPIPFRVLSADHILVEQRTNLEPNVPFALLDAGNYTVALNAETGMGSLTTTFAWDAESDLRIFRSLPILQETIYPVGGPFPAKSHESALDYQTMVSQQLAEGMANTLQIRVSESQTGPGILPPIQDGIIGFDGGVLTIQSLEELAALISGLPPITIHLMSFDSDIAPTFDAQ